jgi:hypothetical protein
MPQASPPVPPQILTPAAPGNLRVTSPANDYAGLSFAWDAAANAQSYYIEVLNEGGGVIWSSNTGALDQRIGVSPDTRYQVRVRGVNQGTSGPWSNLIRWQVGHARQTGVRDVTATRPWAQQADVNLYRDAPGGIFVPAGVVGHTMTVNLSAVGAFSQINSASRQSFFWSGNVGQTFITGQHGLPWFESFSFQTNGNELCGIVLRGSGWTAFPDGNIRLVGIIRMDGTETYTYQEVYETVAEAWGTAW